MRRANGFIPVRMNGLVTLVIGKDEEDVGLFARTQQVLGAEQHVEKDDQKGRFQELFIRVE